jgi:hypothetical protein
MRQSDTILVRDQRNSSGCWVMIPLAMMLGSCAMGLGSALVMLAASACADCDILSLLGRDASRQSR